MLSKLRIRLRALLRKDRMERELDEEVSHHLERQIEQYIAQGMNPKEARFAALKDFGGVEQAKEECRDARGVSLIEETWQDLRYGARMLVKNPLFAAATIITLALGIGANTAIFSVVYGVLLRPLPYPEPDRLVVLQSRNTRMDYMQSASYQEIRDWRDQSRTLEQASVFADWRSITITGGDRPERVRANVVSPSYLELLGARTRLGRLFTGEDDQMPGAHPVALLSYGLWQRRFGGDPALVGQVIRLNDRPFTVIGILSEDFHDLADESGMRDSPESTEIWLPLMMTSTLFNPDNHTYLEARQARLFFALARLKPGVTVEQTRAEMEAIGRQIEQQHPDTSRGTSVAVAPVHEYSFGNVRDPLLVLMVGTGIILLIGCANIANLLLARAMAREREFSIRAALGASRKRLIGQMLSESLLLSLIGGSLGVLLAIWGIGYLLSLSPGDIPRLQSVGINNAVLAFSAAVSLLATMLFGLVPALRASRPDLNEVIKKSGQASSGAGRHSFRGAFVICQIAAALMLLIGAGLVIKSFLNLRANDIGINTANLLTMRLDLRSSKYETPQARLNFSNQMIEQAQGLPGVEAAVLWGPQLPGQTNFSFDIIPDGRLGDSPEDRIRVNRHHMNPGALEKLGMRLLQGREFTEQDTDQAPQIAIVSETVAREAWPGENAVGKKFRSDPADPWTTVVGVVADVNHRGRLNNIRGEIKFADAYFPFMQRPLRDAALLVRAGSDPQALTSSLRQTLYSIDSDLAIYDVATMDQRLRSEEAGNRFSALLMGCFALLALFLASVGIYGLLAYSVTERTREIGIRMALGAQPRDVQRLVLGHGLKLASVGLAIGLAASFVLMRLMESLLFGVNSTDPETFILMSLLLLAITLVACYLPSRRATKVDPITALRYE